MKKDGGSSSLKVVWCKTFLLGFEILRCILISWFSENICELALSYIVFGSQKWHYFWRQLFLHGNSRTRVAVVFFSCIFGWKRAPRYGQKGEFKWSSSSSHQNEKNEKWGKTGEEKIRTNHQVRAWHIRSVSQAERKGAEQDTVKRSPLQQLKQLIRPKRECPLPLEI
jgi:hypothetical protein